MSLALTTKLMWCVPQEVSRALDNFLKRLANMNSDNMTRTHPYAHSSHIKVLKHIPICLRLMWARHLEYVYRLVWAEPISISVATIYIFYFGN